MLIIHTTMTKIKDRKNPFMIRKIIRNILLPKRVTRMMTLHHSLVPAQEVVMEQISTMKDNSTDPTR